MSVQAYMTVILSKYIHSKNAFKTVLGCSEAKKNNFLVLAYMDGRIYASYGSYVSYCKGAPVLNL